MKEKKNIDRLYQEKFRDFEATPGDAVWKSLSAKLQKKEKKKYIVKPLWPKMAGVAAVISFLLMIGDWFLQPQQNQVVSGEEQMLEEENSNEIVLPQEISVVATNSSEEKIDEEISLETIEKVIGKTVSHEPILKKESVSETSSISFSGIRKAIASIKSLGSSISMNATSEKEKVSPSEYNGRSIIEDLNAPLPEEKTNNSVGNRFEVKTHAAPIYYGNFGKGNFLDSQFDGNSSEGEVTYSYGINIAYALSKKLQVRSGINKVSMSYNTSDIAFQSVVNPAAVSSINYRGDITAVTTSGRTKGAPATTARKASFGNLATGLLNQKLGYLEVPVELEYMLINRTFEVNIIGGASTLFLDENMISVNSGSVSTNLGEANNLNNVSFSTNIGLGVDYNLTKQFKLNVEPMFKYQINTFNEASGEFRPYYLGIYSGFSYEF